MEVDLNGLRRYELKYTVTESLARAIRDYIQPLFSLDQHASPQERGYIVNNVYLDTPGLRQQVCWKDRDQVAADGPIRLRANFGGLRPEDVRLYAMYLSTD